MSSCSTAVGPLRRLLIALLLGICFAPLAGATEAPIDLRATLQQYIQIDTTNPPGNEIESARFLARIFEQHGVEYEVIESRPGRGNIVARIEGGPEPALVLLHHMDIVAADPRFWSQDPLSGAIVDGYLHGRGTLDTKGLGIFQLAAFLELHRRGEPLRRDILYIATADEEAGGAAGAGWLVENRPELFNNVGFLLNEGGGGRSQGGKNVYSVEVTQKVPLWLRMTASGVPGHGSSPRVDSSVTRLLRALNHVEELAFAPRLVPATKRYFEALASAEPETLSAFADPERALSDPSFLEALQRANPMLHALTRNTCSITRLSGSDTINVIPTLATAELDCRLLPDQDPQEFVAELHRQIDDERILLKVLMSFSPAVSSTSTELYQAIEDAVLETYPGARVLPSVAAGFTDSHFFRDLGIASYGFSPALVRAQDMSGVHGNNERISLENVDNAWHLLLDVIRRIAVDTTSTLSSGGQQ